MQFKVTPKVGPRYWTAISIASICGTNLGDYVPDVLKMDPGTGLLLLAVVFAGLVIVDRLSKRGSEAFYWLAILTVRAAATNIADFSIGKAHLAYTLVATVVTLLLCFLVALQLRVTPRSSTGDLPPTSGFYWLCMLTAGTLGTVIGDGLGHSFSSVSIGVPMSAGLSTVVLATLLGVRARTVLNSIVSYWIVVVAVRWWGTNVGDILAFVMSLSLSLVVSGLLLALTLVLWRKRETQRGIGESAVGA
ncbi:putative membrane-anchored protein [Granulicella aggregans]|uniref:Putative membrane-anchored protein n=1 Tax=Granulicella aggregans TaxID=474949 RepID=A0A7W7ZJU6_9BACT|nr:hypothetical protein [Granulicella aggregans]MBB5060884.1 putative membrane-anchored protein [Granulicella aggregans]